MEKILTGEARGKGLPGGGKTDQRPGALHVQGTIKEEDDQALCNHRAWEIE